MAKGGLFTNTYKHGKATVNIGVKVVSWEEEGIYYYYSPALDLTGYGKSKQDALKSFDQTLNDFVNYTHNKKTIFEELERLGWTVNKKKKRVQAPSEDQMLEDNETYQKLSNLEGVQLEQKEIALAL
jgi:hypothetical protein